MKVAIHMDQMQTSSSEWQALKKKIVETQQTLADMQQALAACQDPAGSLHPVVKLAVKNAKDNGGTGRLVFNVGVMHGELTGQERVIATQLARLADRYQLDSYIIQHEDNIDGYGTYYPVNAVFDRVGGTESEEIIFTQPPVKLPGWASSRMTHIANYPQGGYHGPCLVMTFTLPKIIEV